MKHKKEAPQPEKTVGEDKRGEDKKSENNKGMDKKTGSQHPGDIKPVDKKSDDKKTGNKTGDKKSADKEPAVTSADAGGKQSDGSPFEGPRPDATNVENVGQQYSELLDRYQRTMAEFDNFRKRTNKEKAAMYDDGLRDTVEKLLPIIDNFERALNAGTPNGASNSTTNSTPNGASNSDSNDNNSSHKEDKFYQGVLMIARQIGAYLTDLGVEVIPAEEGEAFNPNYHFAVAHIEDPAYGTNVVVNELQRGYRHKDKVIRPSMVRVAN